MNLEKWNESAKGNNSAAKLRRQTDFGIELENELQSELENKLSIEFQTERRCTYWIRKATRLRKSIVALGPEHTAGKSLVAYLQNRFLEIDVPAVETGGSRDERR